MGINLSDSDQKNNKPKINKKYINFNQVLNTIYNEEINEIDSQIKLTQKNFIKIEPYVFYDKFGKDIKVEFKLGNKRMYKIKDLSEFYTRMILNQQYKYGSSLEFIHTKEVFDEDSKPILEFIMKYAEIIKYANSNASSRYYGKALNDSFIVLTNTAIDEFFDIIKNRNINIQIGTVPSIVQFIKQDPDMFFELNKKDNEYIIRPQFDIYKVILINGKMHKYVLTENKFYRCSKEFENSNLKLLDIFKKNYITEVTFGNNELIQLFSVIMPKIKKAIRINSKLEESFQNFIPQELKVKVYLDVDSKGFILCDVEFYYGQYKFNPLKEEKHNIPRNILEETKVLSVFRKSGFMLDVKNFKFIMPEDDKIYDFLSQDIDYYMEKYEVLVTENFKSKKIIRPKISSIGVKVENNLLNIDLEKINISIEEIQEVLEKYRVKSKYYRLKNGSFLNLKDSNEISFLENLVDGLDLKYKKIEDGKIIVPINRIMYLEQLLSKIQGTDIIRNQEYNNIINNIDETKNNKKIKIPEQLKTVLRPYQETGFKWLKTLDEYKFGGILADDMGLGKTIQILALLLDYIKNNKQKRASLVVCPSSLALNWQSEIRKFTNELKIKVISGNVNNRKNIINNLEQYDLIITSYDLLKRDIEYYKEKNYIFKYIIADEAQYLKNNNTQNAKAIKEIKATNRFALTGTPIENSLAELWSIFDFIMPGYLFEYKKFKTNYETLITRDSDIETMNKLKMLIEPFVLRRTKKQVLTELPEKTISVFKNEMNEEQKNIYISYLMQAKQEIKEQIDEKGYEKSQIKILAALTRLRQICCHPSLFIEGYNQSSSKLEQCMEIVEEGINAGHKILLFSSYTSMFNIIEEQLENRNIKYYKLTGSTKVNERLEMVEDFNENKEVKIFLISLKAGGTGLNLTGADMVIHYDPWWNISAENQATDRAYRIGQKNNVQVYKLITEDSIEEKIYELQQRKEKLTNDMLDMKTTFINKLSKEEIMHLFD